MNLDRQWGLAGSGPWKEKDGKMRKKKKTDSGIEVCGLACGSGHEC